MLKQQQSEIREIVLGQIAGILQDVYHEPVRDLSTVAIRAQLAFKANPDLNELRLALDRMDREEYGQCIFCKHEIGAEELKDCPTAHFCNQCSDILRHRTTPQDRSSHLDSASRQA